MSNDTENYSASAASNTADWPEGMAPSAVNDAGRESQADIRRWKDRIDGTAAAGGTVDALTATFSPTLTALYDGRTIVLRAAGANATTTPTFSPDGLTAKTIVRAGNQALVAGDIRGAGHFLILKYNTANDVWELMNPHYGGASTIAAGTAGPKIQTAALEQTDTLEAVTSATIRAGAVDQTAVGANAIGQSELKSTTASQSAVVGAGGINQISLTGGSYTMGWYAGGGGTYQYVRAHLAGYSAVVGIENTDTSSQTFQLYSRYVQASPPYNLGNGDIALFIMAKINTTTKEVLATEVATDPFWAYHGLHDLHPYYGKLQKAAGLWGVDIKKVLTGQDSAWRNEVLDRLATLNRIKTDPAMRKEALSARFSMSEKNIDKDIAPHGMGACGKDEAIVFIDPVGTITDQLSVIHEDMSGVNFEGGSVTELLESKYIEIGDPLNAVAPSGVTAVSARWKNTV